MAITLGNRIRVSTSTTGTGSITLGSAETGFQTFAAGGISDGDEVRFVITEGSAFEISKGTYTHSGTVLSRTLLESTTGALLNLQGNAKVFVTAAAEDLMLTDGGTFTGDVKLNDNVKLYLGSDSDVSIEYDPNTFRINAGSWNAQYQAGNHYFRNAGGSVNALIVDPAGAITLKHNNSTKLETASGGVTITGTATATAFSGDGSGLTNLPAGATNEGTGNFIGGTNAGASLQSGGEDNTLLGQGAGDDITTADGSTIVGKDAGRFITTSGYNTAIGWSTGTRFGPSGSFNTAIGVQALGGNSQVYDNNSYNVAIGANALNNASGGRLRNVAIGYNTAQALTSGDNNIILGYDAEASSATISNEITIGDANVTRFRLPGLQAGASDGQVMTFNSSTGLIDLADVSGVPSGVICMWGGAVSSIPSGWYLCDGNNSTPDLRDRFIVGSGTDSGGTHDIGDTGGANSVTLSESNLPAHTHGSGSLATSSAGAHTHSMSLYQDHYSGSWNIGGNRSSYVASASTNSAGAHTHSITGSTGSTGSGSSVENRPSYYALAYIQKA